MKICGLDECGRGAFAGPLVAAAVVINSDLETFPSLLPVPLRDSKKLTEIQRNKIYSLRSQLPIVYKIEEVSVLEINEHGMGWANKEIFERLVNKINARIYVIDGNLKFSNSKIHTLIKGDDKCYPVMLASILAKVYRDNLLKKLHEKFPDYAWDQNSGYGTGYHLSVIKELGATPMHRMQYVNTYLKHQRIVDTQLSQD
ncbi:MAG: Ribonuclease HII [Candidatus Collierbacteria bacterium GW2011_GWB1_44_6]|uniref:Ribonuclease n=2 Tax=Candidatus Collieribacteriota TaxID=1752725 RepID=A0A0G1JKY9_9BACT|nr:MAG: Ribonuclease HII [Candidatus Collierbacteria bacterium GW2011_GWC2_43_12]KKT72216.1 MAG: Ribonuclease HII [Candidatus Collierbacteria bacterium GW2011_GWB1_44_6]KKT82856.1 MAG: Ribonuclease HII [Microgenomates group bacterium GW2011_GWC1_44_9]